VPWNVSRRLLGKRKGQAQSGTLEASTLITLFVKNVEIFKNKYLFQRILFFG
jgi:hypothetical protein